MLVLSPLLFLACTGPCSAVEPFLRSNSEKDKLQTDQTVPVRWIEKQVNAVQGLQSPTDVVQNVGSFVPLAKGSDTGIEQQKSSNSIGEIIVEVASSTKLMFVTVGTFALFVALLSWFSYAFRYQDRHAETNSVKLRELLSELRGHSLQDLMNVSAKRSSGMKPEKRLKTQRERNACLAQSMTFASTCTSEQETDVPTSGAEVESCSEVEVESPPPSDGAETPRGSKSGMPTLPEDTAVVPRTKGVVVASTTDSDLHRRKSFEDKDTIVESEDPNDTGAAAMHIYRSIGLGVACKKGMKPGSPNQDSFSAVAMPGHFQLHGVYDGHGPHGHHVSQFVKENLPKLFFRYLAATTAPEQAMTKAFKDVQQLLWRATLDGQLDAQQSGSTATLAYMPEGENKVVIAHVGDSRAMIVDARGHRDITMDHKPTLPAERERIERNGGEVRTDGFMQHRVFVKGQRYPGINMSRALGDLWAHRRAGLSAVPDVQTVSLGPGDLVLVLASDGVWEFIESSQCAASIRSDLHAKDGVDRLQVATERLAHQSWEYWMQDTGNKESDDITALCVRLNASGPPPIVSSAPLAAPSSSA